MTCLLDYQKSSTAPLLDLKLPPPLDPLDKSQFIVLLPGRHRRGGAGISSP